MKHTDTPNSIKKQHARLVFKRESIRALYHANLGHVAYRLRLCSSVFQVEICTADPNHAPKAFPMRCGLAICEECAQRESYRKLSSYLPALQKLLTPNPDFPDNFLFKLTLTSPFELHDLSSATFKAKQNLVRKFLNAYFYEYFEKKGKLSKGEISRGRCDLKKHGIGGLRSAEFGERGKRLHWHMLMYAPYMPKPDVWRVWTDVTDGQCINVDIAGIKARDGGKLRDAGDIIGAVQEIVKYATKFSELPASDVPQLYKVLKGNRRFESFGVLYNQSFNDSEEIERTCKECSGKLETLRVGQYVTRCMNRGVDIDDSVADEVERGIALYLSRDYEITLGKSPALHRKARDSIESETQ